MGRGLDRNCEACYTDIKAASPAYLLTHRRLGTIQPAAFVHRFNPSCAINFVL